MKIVVINGAATAGKSSFVELCAKHITWCGEASTIDFAKKIAMECGWNGKKDSKSREFLSNLKDVLTAYNDTPYKKVEGAARVFEHDVEYYGFDTESAVFFIHCREPQEISKIVKRMDAKTLYIKRDSAEKILPSNHADADVANYEYDYTIENNGTIDELEQKAIQFLHTLGIKGVK